MMMVVVFFTAIYVGWFMNTNLIVDEIEKGAPAFKTTKVFGVTLARIWVFTIRFVAPVIISIVILNMFGVFG